MLITRKLVMTKDVGCNDNLYGGNMLKWLDEAAAVFAMLYCREPRMVTVKFDELVFKNPVKVGTMIEFYGNVTKEGVKSVEFAINVEAVEFKDEVICTPVVSTKAVFVAIDENGKSKEIEKFKGV